MDRNLIRQTIVEMIKSGDLQIETSFSQGNYSDKLITTVYYCDESMDSREVIQENKYRLNEKL
ncbi:hypothetical protein [Robertmurraya siralis]|uniref:hypothetical protein n=1 Tax=Robertmurraya siralis TaxID=77777 RepID=UPI0010F7290B|nr:hypothetical protein [Robertmurraya siralis]